MSRRTRSGNPKNPRQRLIDLLEDFEHRLNDDDLREQVRALVPAVHLFRDMGSSLISEGDATSARDRILFYLRRYTLTVISGDELAVVSGIPQYARRIRELRKEYGWPIYSGETAKQMISDEDSGSGGDLFGPTLPAMDIHAMKNDDYILVGGQDRNAALRWQIANDVRKSGGSIRDRLLRYLRQNVGQPVTGEELRYVANKQSWPRRTRELRTEQGWPVATRNSGHPNLPIGVYLLEADRQTPSHDRNIPDPVRVSVLKRDDFRCRCCGWQPEDRKSGDPRALLELHHIEYHAEGGSNEAKNLITLCNVHHDEMHRRKLKGQCAFGQWIEENC